MIKTFMQLYTQKPPRFAWFLGAGLIVIVVWTVAVFEYGSFKWSVFQSGVYVAPLTFKYQVDQFVEAWREHAVIIVAFLGFALTPICRRLVRQPDLSRTHPRDWFWLGLFLTLTYALFAWDQYVLDVLWLERTNAAQLGDQRSNFGLLFAALAGLLGGWRVGLMVGLVNMFVLGWQNHTLQLISKYPDQAAISTILMQLWGLVGVVGGAVLGAWREAGKSSWRPLPLLVWGTLLEVVAVLATLATTWAAPYIFDRFMHNLLATGPLLALLSWWLHRQAQSDPRALQLTQSELALTRAELRALRAQMNPHFLINALSVIHHLMRTEPERARTLMLDLSDVLQHTLRSGDFVTLGQEIEQTKAYLALEQARYTKRLRVEWAIDEDVPLE
jgi:LytS/YehU family sensor histidine kinase